MAKKKAAKRSGKTRSTKDLKARKDVRGGMASTRLSARRPLGVT
jgi:hypothetical protein